MVQKKRKNNKKGFSLPLAIGITAFLILISASLLFIASNSISNTSGDINSRQAYLNLKSALYYSRAYYEKVESISEIGVEKDFEGKKIREEYITMNDSGGTVDEGAKVSSAISDTDNASTYVIARYIPASTGGEKAVLKLIAYANYSDAFGHKSKTAHLNYDLTVSPTDKNTGRITGGMGGSDQSNGDPETVTLNVKKPKDLNWAMATYIYSYKDKTGIYKDKAHYESFGMKIGEGNNTVDNINQNELRSNETHPAGPWVAGIGPQTAMVSTGNNWYTNTFHTQSSDVHYFNVILTKIGADLSSDPSAQTPEMFHLWYLDPQDKNIYFEILKNNIYYYTDPNWDGKTNLEDTVLVYVKNPKTTVHVMVEPKDVSATTPTTFAPVLNNIKENGSPLSGESHLHSGNKTNNNITMQYEGCGWWVANVESGNSFSMEINYNHIAFQGVSVSSSTNKEAWIVLKNNSFTYYSSEATACSVMGVDKNSYVTVHAKASNYQKDTDMKLSYSSNALLSSTEREKLRLKIVEANNIDTSEFEEESVKKLAEVVNEGATIYNDENYIKNAPGPTNTMKIKQAAVGYTNRAKGITAIGYNKAVQNIDDAISKLKPRTIDAETYNEIQSLLQKLKKMLEDKENYDYDMIVRYENGIYDKALKDLDNQALTLAEAVDDILQLNTAISDMEEHGKLNKAPLQALIDESRPALEDTKYEKADRDIFRVVFEQAETLIKSKDGICQSKDDDNNPGLNQMLNKLTEAYNTLKKTYKTPLDTAAFDAVAAQVSTYINSNPTADYTKAGMDNLKEVYERTSKLKYEVSTTQEMMNNATTELQTAFDNCKIKKPVNTAEKLYSEDKKIRVYISSFRAYGSSTVTMNQFVMYMQDNANGNNRTAQVSGKTMPYDHTVNAYYYDVDTSKYDTIYFEYSSLDKNSDSIDLTDYKDGNLLVKLSYAFELGWGYHINKVTVEKTTTLYLELYPSTPTVYVGNTAYEVASTGNGDGYTMVCFPYQANKTVKVAVDNTVVSQFTAQQGEWVVRKNSNEPISVSEIYPIYATNSKSGTGYTIQNEVANGTEFRVINVANNNGINQQTEKFMRDTFDVPLPDNSCIILFDLSADDMQNTFRGYTPYLEAFAGDYTVSINGRQIDKYTTEIVQGATPQVVWDSRTMKAVGAPSPGYKMVKYKNTKYYYSIVPKTCDGYMINAYNEKTGSVRQYLNFSNMKIEKYTKDYWGRWRYSGTDTSSCMPSVFPNKGVKAVPNYYVFSHPVSGESYKINPYEDSPIIEVPIASLDTDDIRADELSMPFVGGKKVRITNKPYQTWGKKDGNGNDYDNSRYYGGYKNGRNCFGRVGDSQMTRYIDWTEYKLPVPASSVYTFSIKGLNNNDNNVETININNAMGDVWISLDKTDKNSEGKYNKLKLYSFNPDDETTDDTKRVYFDVPSGWNVNSLTIQQSGIGNTTVSNMTNHLSTHSSYYYYDVDVNRPFITFTITDDKGAARSYKTSVQGGDYVLFRPDTGSTISGNWDTFVSAQDSLYQAVSQAQSMYYGNYLVKKYIPVKDAADEVVGYEPDNDSSNFIKSSKLYDAYKDFSTRSSGSDTIRADYIRGLDEASALSSYQSVQAVINSYQNIYDIMRKARSYIEKPVVDGHEQSGFKYPEYFNNKVGSTVQYTEESMKNLTRKYDEAFKTYRDGGNVDRAARNLKAAIDGLEVSSEGAITVILYDAQAKLRGSDRVEICYKKDGMEVTKNVTEKNDEGFPGIRITADEITDVAFHVNGHLTGITKNTMKQGETWILVDLAAAAQWQTWGADYRDIKSDEFEQAGSDSMKFSYQKKDEKDNTYISLDYPLVLNFFYNTNVKYSGGEYDIKAGQYIFDLAGANKDLTKLSKAITVKSYDTITDASGIKTYKIKEAYIDLYSDAAKAYFTDPSNYGDNSSVTSESIGWTDSNGEFQSPASISDSSGNVKFTAKNGVFSKMGKSRMYMEKKGSIYFRWDSKNPLKVNDMGVLGAKSQNSDDPDLVIAIQRSTSSADIIGTTTASKLYLQSADPTASSMVVQFLTDTRVSYKDAGGSHTFWIRAGIYEISKANKTDTYIANIFDETYWKSHEYIKMKQIANSGASSSSGSTVTFDEGSFSA